MLTEDQIIQERLTKLSYSKFRSRFHFNEKDKQYIEEKGLKKIKEHAYDFVSKRLSGREIENDGKQTPMRGHPVFIAQHATATCCRNCLSKWHHIEKGHDLSETEKKYVVHVIMSWIRKQIS